MPINLVTSYATISLCHPCYTFQCVYLHTLQVYILIKRYRRCGHSVSCHTDNPELTNDELFIGLIELRHVTKVWQSPIKAGWRDRPLAFPNLAEILNKMLYLWPSPSRGHQTVTIMIHNCYSLMTSGKGTPNMV